MVTQLPWGTRDKVILKRTGASLMQRHRPRGEALLAFLDGTELGEERWWGHPTLCSHPSCCCVLTEGSVIGGPLSSKGRFLMLFIIHEACRLQRPPRGPQEFPPFPRIWEATNWRQRVILTRHLPPAKPPASEPVRKACRWLGRVTPAVLTGTVPVAAPRPCSLLQLPSLSFL